jgi:hypothetical protein
MMVRLYAAQLARQIARALHVPAPEQTVQQIGQVPTKRKAVKARKKRKVA